MNDRRGLREEYGDLLGPDDDAATLEVVRLLDAAGAHGRPPDGMAAAVRTAIRERAARTESAGSAARDEAGWEAVPEETAPPRPGPIAGARPQRNRRLFPAFPRLGQAAGLAAFVLLVGAIVAGLAAVLPGMRDAQTGGEALAPDQVRFELAIEGDLPEGEAFEVVYYPGGGAPRYAPLCGPDELLDGPPASVPPCRGGETYSATVTLPRSALRELSYNYANLGEIGVIDTFAWTGEELVPAGTTYSVTYTYPPGVGQWREAQPIREPGGRAAVIGRISGRPSPGRLGGIAPVRATERRFKGALDYQVTVSYDTPILRRGGGRLVRAGYGDLKEGQRVRLWVGGEIILEYPGQVDAAAIVIEGS